MYIDLGVREVDYPKFVRPLIELYGNDTLAKREGEDASVRNRGYRCVWRVYACYNRVGRRGRRVKMGVKFRQFVGMCIQGVAVFMVRIGVRMGVYG
ncbi:MAG: hypothetical protein OXT74_07520 [Candidatus Poribacteria bacterium]|nr:hypothetical protein [Candidatus Poribacteria bacterium]